MDQTIRPLILGSLVVLGCRGGGLPAGLHSDPADPLETIVKRSPLGASPDTEVLSLPPEGRAWLAERFGPALAPHPHTLTVLSTAIAEKGALGIGYEQLAVSSAAETLVERVGNCLSQTHLLIALARAMGMRATYREVYRMPDWNQVGKLRIQNRHVAARIHIEGYGTWQVDFGEATHRPNEVGRDLSDEEARALHFNNLGVLALTRGETEAAVRHFNRALLLSPRVAYFWANLGTALLRRGDVPSAEAALRRSVKLDANDVVALTTLARLYRLEGATKLSEGCMARAETARFKHPFVLYQKGLTALRSGNVETSIRLLEEAVRGLPELMRLRADLGRAYFQAERYGDARAAFKVADQLAKSEADRTQLKRLLVELTGPPAPLPTVALKSKGGEAEAPTPSQDWP